jgi:hypothetical protein
MKFPPQAEESLLAAKYFVGYAQRKYPGWPYEVKHVLDAEMVGSTWCCLHLR